MEEKIVESLNNLKNEFKKIKTDARNVKDKNIQQAFGTEL